MADEENVVSVLEKGWENSKEKDDPTPAEQQIEAVWTGAKTEEPQVEEGGVTATVKTENSGRIASPSLINRLLGRRN